jgi:hypothetical protein
LIPSSRFANRRADAEHPLLRGNRTDVRAPGLRRIAPTKRVTQKVELLFRQFTDPRLRFVHRQFQLRHHVPHRRQRFFSVAATADHQVISIVNDVCSKTLLVPELLPSRHEPTMYKLLSIGLIGAPWGVPRPSSRLRVLRSFVASCVPFQLRLLPSTGITRLRRYCEPLRHPSQPGLSLASCQSIRTAITAGTSRVTHGPLCLHAVANTPAGRMEFLRSYHSLRFGLPHNRGGSAPALVFSRPIQRSLTLRPARSPSRLRGLLRQRLQQSRCLRCCSDCYRVERTSSRAGIPPLWTSAFHGAPDYATYPPSMVRLAPVMKPASSDAR